MYSYIYAYSYNLEIEPVANNIPREETRETRPPLADRRSPPERTASGTGAAAVEPDASEAHGVSVPADHSAPRQAQTPVLRDLLCAATTTRSPAGRTTFRARAQRPAL